ncbi:MAG: OmpA family protein [Nibricoccus sp.]
MNLSKKLCLVLACTLVVFTGCFKKPQRPTVDQTVVGGGSGLPNNGNENFTTDPNSPLKGRDEAGWNGNKNYDLLQPVYFDFDKSSIKESERAKLQAAKEYLEKNPDQRLLIEGHADWRGTAEYNLGLGDRRANACKAYLIKIGVAQDKVETISKGSLEAKEKGTSDEMAKDRRGQLVVVKP